MGDVNDHSTALRLLAHPFTGLRDASDGERAQLIDAAAHIDVLRAALDAMTAERDRLQVERVEEARRG